MVSHESRRRYGAAHKHKIVQLLPKAQPFLVPMVGKCWKVKNVYLPQHKNRRLTKNAVARNVLKSDFVLTF